MKPLILSINILELIEYADEIPSDKVLDKTSCIDIEGIKKTNKKKILKE